MTFDLLGAIELTASAAILVTVLSVGLATSTRARAALAAGFGLWFLAVTALAAGGTLHRTDIYGVAGVAAAVLVPILALVGAGAISRRVRQALFRIPVASLVAVHAVRVLGVSFVVLHAQGRLPAPFAPVAGWGDIAVGLAAPLVAWLVATHHAAARPALVAWNALGLADLAAAVGLGVASSPGILNLLGTGVDAGLITTLPWLLIPGFLVPLLAATHLAIFFRLHATEAGGLWTPRRQAVVAGS